MQLSQVVEDLRHSVKRLSLETKMFEGKINVFDCCKNAKNPYISNWKSFLQALKNGSQLGCNERGPGVPPISKLDF